VDDGEWAKLIAAGDERARSQFVTTFHGQIYRWLRYLCASVDAAQELTQDTFVEALQAITRFEGRASISTWLHRVAYYRYTHWLRERRRDLQWLAPLEAADASVDTTSSSHWESLCLKEALAQLSEEHRDTFVLHYVQQLSVLEVAEVLGVPAGTVQSRLFHARKRLRELLRDGLDGQSTGRSPADARPNDKKSVQEVIIS
jgi:RNA polymerase sigma-70 factor (ECF subfamily)